MPRIKRIARNQALFREVNQRIAELAAHVDQEAQSFICECAETGCTETISVPIETYARIRDDPTLFLLVNGHQDPAHEVVVEDLDSYLIVQTKAGAARESRPMLHSAEPGRQL